MKINRFIALAMIALLITGAMGFFSSQSFAKGSAQSEDCSLEADIEDDDAEEAEEAEDTDNIEHECGDQNDADEADDD